MRVKVTEGSALIIVDVQNDFMPGGSLPVPSGDKVIPVINKLIEGFKGKGMAVIASRDWHPEDHISFKQWPVHCVQGTKGAEFHPLLELPADVIVISKGTSPDKEAYSAFKDTELEAKLKELGIKRLFVTGVATEYCVKETVLDALERGYQTFVVLDAIKGIKEDDEERAKEEMLNKGAVLLESEEISF